MSLRLIHQVSLPMVPGKNRTIRLPERLQRRSMAGFLLPFLLLVTMTWMSMRQVHAQTNLASITGTVTDSTGAALPNVSVSILNTDTTAVRVVTTDATGFYTAPSLNVGSYRITATAAGFDKAVVTASLTLGGLNLDLHMKVGNVSEEITVTGSSGSVALQTDSNEVSTSVDSAQLTQLPNSGRSLLSIATLGPASQNGTDSSTSAGDQSFFGQTSNAVILAGLGPNQTQFLQDGIDNTNLLTQTANILASVEAAKEVSALYSNAPAIFRQPAIVNVITKSGSNHFHGTVYDFLQNDAGGGRSPGLGR